MRLTVEQIETIKWECEHPFGVMAKEHLLVCALHKQAS
jgi:hypothetical protein